jgi:hypothetical protein
MKKNTLLYFVLALLVILPTLTQAQLNCYSLQAPEFAIEGMKNIAIMNFKNRNDVNWRYSNTNDYGAQLAGYMIGLLLEEHRGVYTKKKNKANKVAVEDMTVSKLMKQNKAKKFAKGTNFMERYRTDVYTIVDRGALDEIIAEQLLGVSGAVSDADAAEVGKLLGLDVIVTGGYMYDLKTSVKSTGSGENAVYIAKKKITMDVTMKIISIETGQVLSMTIKTASKKRTTTGGSRSEVRNNLVSDEQIIRECLEDISKKMVAHFAPTFVYQKLEVEKPASKDYNNEFKEARTLVQNDDLSGAFSILKDVYDADPYDAAMAHNMGVIYEAVGNFEEAIEYHKTAYEIDPSKGHKTALEHALNSKEALDELGRLGADITPYKFDSKAKERLSIVKVTTKGKKADRHEVYGANNKDAEVLAKIPGDTYFVLISQDGPWYRIKLLGGKEGFISQEFIKK